MNMDDSTINPSKSPDIPQLYTFQQPLRQLFTIPFLTIDYICTNPSSGKAWKKLIQTCKYFYSKNSLYPIKCLRAQTKLKWDADKEELDFKKPLPKLWLFRDISFSGFVFQPNIFTIITPKIYKFSLQNAEIYNQILSWNDYKIFTTAKSLLFFDTEILDVDDAVVTMDKLLENLNNIQSFQICCTDQMFEPETVKKIVEILPRLKRLHMLHFYGLTQCFDFSSFVDFLTKNKRVNVHLSYKYAAPLAETYKDVIECFIDELIAKPPRKIPYINFRGFEGVRYEKYENLCRRQKRLKFG